MRCSIKKGDRSVDPISKVARKPAHPPARPCMCACACVTHAQVEARVAKDRDHARMAGPEGLGHVNPAAGAVDKVQLSSSGPSHLRQHKVQTNHCVFCVCVRVCMRGAPGRCRSRSGLETVLLSSSTSPGTSSESSWSIVTLPNPRCRCLRHATH